MTIQIVEPRPAQVLEFWDEIEPHMARALSYDTYNTISVAQLKDQVSNGWARVLICGEDSRILAVTVAQRYRGHDDERLLHVIATGGEESHRWLARLSDHLNAMAASEKCTAVTMAGRPGWARKLTKLGYRTDMISMRREVDYGSREINSAVDAGQPADGEQLPAVAEP